MLHRVALALVLGLLLAPASHAAAPDFWRIEGTAAFLKGEIENLSLSSEGRLSLGAALQTLADLDVPNAWCVSRGDDGVLYVGTGNDGRVFRVEGHEARVLFDAEQLEVHAVAVGPDQRVYAATSPNGAVYAIDADGAASPFFDPDETYIWALVFDDDANLVVATGREGRVYRVHPDRTSERLLSSADTHVLSLALDGDGQVYAGSSPEGVVYRIGRQGDIFVLYDSPFREIKFLTLAEDGALYAGAVGGGPSTPAAPPTPPTPPTTPPTTPTGEVTVTESFALPAAPGGPPAPTPSTPSTPPPTTPKGAVLRIDPTGTVETLWKSADDMPHVLAPTEGGVLVGTGDEGKLFHVLRDGRWSLLARLPAQQVTGIAEQRGKPTTLVTSNPARLLTLSPAMAAEGTLVSEIKDAGTVAAWGRARWEGRAPEGTEVRLETRSGNTSAPDATWGEWTAVGQGTPAAPIKSESARFLQIRITVVGQGEATPEIEAVSAAFLQRNLRPRITSITVYPPGQVFPKPITAGSEPEVLGLEPDPLHERDGEQPAMGMPTVSVFGRSLYRKGLRTFMWKADDDNGDSLVFEVHYRAVGDERWRLLRQDLTEPVLAWDTTSMPDGRYLIRVIASDAPDNPPAMALSGHEDSTSFEVDNTPPTLVASLAAGRPDRVRAEARDVGSRIQRLEFSVDAGRWQQVYPVDGINDSSEETYEFAIPSDRRVRPRVVVLRVSDRLGNVATSRVDVP
jgi:sugar lactone lactonase YvrE